MDFKEYQERTNNYINTDLTATGLVYDSVLGINSEAGEIADLIRKSLNKIPVEDYHEKLKLEIGDLLYYACQLCMAEGFNFEDIAALNIMKLKKRYPKGRYTNEDHIARKDVE